MEERGEESQKGRKRPRGRAGMRIGAAEDESLRGVCLIGSRLMFDLMAAKTMRVRINQTNGKRGTFV